jgi:hypothetical protein
MAAQPKPLELRIHGRVLEHLGIQMYQSPVNAVAETIANAWDADAEEVGITIPDALGEGAEITVADNGIGMTHKECQDRFLAVGWNRRGDDPNQRTAEKKRPVIGRKGIGKFAGFGIARRITIRTVSKATGEATTFVLHVEQLMGDEYVGATPKPIPVEEYLPADEARRAEHGTTVSLGELTLGEIPPVDEFRRSMARRFLLHEAQSDFRVTVNAEPLPRSLSLQGAQYVFPKDYRPDESPTSLGEVDEEGWGTETLPSGATICWRFVFHEDTVDEDELRGVAVFAKGKIVQAPFLFRLAGGLSGQWAPEYLTGQVRADFLDADQRDRVAPERQRVNWDDPKAAELLAWGQRRVKKLMALWRDRRGEARRKAIEDKLLNFSDRLAKLPAHEAKTVKRALTRLGGVPQISNRQLEQVGEAILTAWESGRLRDLMSEIAGGEELSEARLLELLLEAKVLTALNIAEAVKTKLRTVAGLRDRLQRKELEKAVRDYIAENPWLIAPEWETYAVEKRVDQLRERAAQESGLADYEGRVDLALSSGDRLLLMEFMRPGLTLDRDHLDRFDWYVRIVREGVAASTGGPFTEVSGYMVADSLGKRAGHLSRLRSLASEGKYALTWDDLLQGALRQWEEFLEALVSRAPDDDRLRALLAEDAEPEPSDGAA